MEAVAGGIEGGPNEEMIFAPFKACMFKACMLKARIEPGAGGLTGGR